MYAFVGIDDLVVENIPFRFFPLDFDMVLLL